MSQQHSISTEEREKVLAVYFKDGFDKQIDIFPSKEKKKLIILQQICKRFEPQRMYTEKEVNELLKPSYHDHVSIRRYLIEYGFMERNTDCTAYWLKE